LLFSVAGNGDVSNEDRFEVSIIHSFDIIDYSFTSYLSYAGIILCVESALCYFSSASDLPIPPTKWGD